MEYLFFLNGEHEELAFLEVTSLIRAYGMDCHVKIRGRQTLVLDTGHLCLEMLSRLALTHRAMRYLGALTPGKGLIPQDALSEVLTEGSFSFRVRKIDKDMNSMEEERRISEQILSKTSANVDLSSPDQELYALYVDGMVHVGYTLFVNDPKSFNERKPQHRPYFHPSSIDPRLARALVNLSEARHEVMDPFCGTGGILIEAGLMGLDVHGVDIEEKMVEGTRRNLGFYGIDGDIAVGDSSKLDISATYETIVTDVPYGKSTVIGNDDRSSLYSKVFKIIYEICGKKVVIVLPMEHDFTTYGFMIDAKAQVRVHKSLVRHIYKLTRP